MKWASLLLFFILLVPFPLMAQGGNQKPRIIGQAPLSTQEDHSLEIDMLYLRVLDADDWFYPWGFTMTLHPGENYTIQGNTVIPAANFAGLLYVKVTVNDGLTDSDPYALEISVEPVNDRPVITGHSALSIREGESFRLRLSHLEVWDPDNVYPDDFTLQVRNGSRYRVNSNEITPTGQFTGTLRVNVRVNDGDLSSATYVLPIEVKPIDRKPRITGQMELQTPEDVPLTVTLNDLKVEDDDSDYPNGFSLALADGDNYSVKGSAILPDSNYFGDLVIPARVNDGKHVSDPYNLTVTVLPVNDAPVISQVESAPLMVNAATARPPVSRTITVAEVDGDSISYVAIAFRGPTYQPNADKLVYPMGADGVLTATFDEAAGILMLRGVASPARYTRALRLVYYENLLPAGQGERIITFTASDGQLESTPVERIIRFGAANVSLEIPTAFTPNGDAANDTWKIVPLQMEDSYAQAHIRVYNRQGILVFESIGFDREWDGRYEGQLLPADTYFYTIDLKLNAPEGYLSGSVTLLR